MENVQRVKLIDFNQLVSVPINIFKGLATVPYNEDENRSGSWIYNVIFVVLIGNLMLINFGQLSFIVNGLRYNEHFLEVMGTIPGIGFSSLTYGKLLTVALGKSRLTRVVRLLKSIFPKTAKLQEEYRLKSYKRFITNTLKLAAAIAIISICIFSFLDVFQTAFEYIFQDYYVRRLPLFVAYPFNVTGDNVYLFMYIHQSFGVYVCTCSILGSDLLLCALVLQICMHFDYLAKKLDQTNPENNDAYDKLSAVVKYHCLLLDLSAEMNTVFGVSLLLNMVSACLIICFVGFEVTAGVDAANLFRFALLLIYEGGHIFLIAYIGNKLTESGESIAIATYNHPWVNADLRYKKSLIFILARSQKATVLNAAGFTIISLHTFQVVITTAYQFFAILSTTYQ